MTTTLLCLTTFVATATAAGGAPPPEPTAPEPTAPEPTAPSAFAPARVPFAFADFSWVPGGLGPTERVLSAGPFTGELRVDTVFHQSFWNPRDNTISGSSEVFRSGELQLTQLGMYSQTTPRNDASPARGQWDLADAYRYLSEAYAGYHVDVAHGLNVQAGIFMSYVGLWSYYNFDNWTYQPSFVSSNTPWFFNGVRVQFFPNEHLKIEPWLVNGWQSYGKFNDAPGIGLQVLWRPAGWISMLTNNYFGSDTLGTPDRRRLHTDNSVMIKYHDDPDALVTRAAVSVTIDAGCEFDGGVGCGDQYFLGFMAYHRAWLADGRVGLTVGGGAITNPGRYLVLLPPINGATAASGTPYFSAAPGDPYEAWDLQLAADYSPIDAFKVAVEFNHRAASVPYFTGPGGVTPPGGNQGAPGSAVPGWAPDLRPTEDRLTVSFGVKL